MSGGLTKLKVPALRGVPADNIGTKRLVEIVASVAQQREALDERQRAQRRPAAEEPQERERVHGASQLQPRLRRKPLVLRQRLPQEEAHQRHRRGAAAGGDEVAEPRLDGSEARAADNAEGQAEARPHPRAFGGNGELLAGE